MPKIKKKEKNSQSLIKFVSNLKKLQDFKVDFSQESLEKVILNPRVWAEKVAEKEIVVHIDKYKEAKVLGEKFAKEITSADSNK